MHNTSRNYSGENAVGELTMRRYGGVYSHRVLVVEDKLSMGLKGDDEMSSDRHRKTSLVQKFRNFELSTKDDIDTVTDAVSCRRARCICSPRSLFTVAP